MANYYVRSGAAGAGTGADWANAYTTLTAALSGKTSSDVLWVADDHSESTVGAVTLTCPSTPGLQILGVNTHVTEPPTALNSTPAAICAVGASNNGLSINGFAYVNAIKFQGATNANSTCVIGICATTTPAGLYFDNCAFELRSASSVQLILGPSGNSTDDNTAELRNCTIKFGATGHSIAPRVGRYIFRNVSFDSAGSTPTTLLTGANIAGGSLLWEASDISGEAWTNLANQAWTSTYDVLIRNCKIPASTSLTTGTHSGPGGLKLRLHNCDSGDTQTNFGEADYCGSVIEESTLVRSGGGAVSYRMDATANTKFPYLALQMEGTIRNTSTGSALTLTVPILHDSATNVQNDEWWVEVIHQGTSGYPQGVLDIDDRAADVFATPADQAADSGSTWTTTGMTNPNKQKLECTFTPQEAGYVYFRVCGAPGTAKTVYVDIGGASIA